MQLSDIEQWKRDQMRDLFRRVLANPENLVAVADEIAADWSPTIVIDEKGRPSVYMRQAA